MQRSQLVQYKSVGTINQYQTFFNVDSRLITDDEMEERVGHQFNMAETERRC